MRRRILYIAMVVILVYLNSMYEWDKGKWMLALLIAAPLAECLFLAVAYWKTKADFAIRPGKEIVTKGDEVFLEWTFKGPFWRYLRDMKIQWREGVSFQPKKEKKRTKKVRAQMENTFSITTKWSGHLKLEVLRYSFTGPIGLIRVGKRVKAREKIVVLPKQIPLQIEGELGLAGVILESNEYSKTKSGDDSAEVFDVRPYRYGDPISRIHWKITARQDEFYVKEFSLPIGASMALLVEKDDEIKSGEKADAFYTLFASIAAGMTERKEPFFVAWNVQDDGMKRFLVSDEESFYTMLFAFLDEELFAITQDAKRIWKDTYPNEECRFLVLTEGMKLQIEEEEPVRFNWKDLEEKLEGWVLELQ